MEKKLVQCILLFVILVFAAKAGIDLVNYFEKLPGPEPVNTVLCPPETGLEGTCNHEDGIVYMNSNSAIPVGLGSKYQVAVATNDSANVELTGYRLYGDGKVAFVGEGTNFLFMSLTGQDASLKVTIKDDVDTFPIPVHFYYWGVVH